jgi:peptidoglycan hydrolase-like protein with peptidoglycan-binding domain
VVALQTLLNCAGYGDLTADGVFGDLTATAVEKAQAAAARQLTGEPDVETFALLARACDREEEIAFGDDSLSAIVVGNVASGDVDRFSLQMQAGQVLTLEADPSVHLRVEGADGRSVSSDDGGLMSESPLTQGYTIIVSATEPTTYLLEIDLSAPETTPTTEASGTTVAPEPFNAADWIGMEWSGDPPDGLVSFPGATDCIGEPSGSVCHDYYGIVVAWPGSFTSSGADNPIEAMAWLTRNTGVYMGDHAVWEIVDAVVFEAPIGDRVLNECRPQAEERNLLAFVDIIRGTVTGAIEWDIEAGDISVIPPDRIVCIDGAGDTIAVGPGFG